MLKLRPNIGSAYPNPIITIDNNMIIACNQYRSPIEPPPIKLTE